ncbi:MAG: carbohydrate ABC transporter permease [Clostridia bacterium]|nr:carbohydrate ABC transporter permease [Clostridia bacterium]
MFGREKEQNILTQRDGAEKVIFGIVFTIISIQILTILIPLGFMLMNSFKGRMEFNVTNLWTPPKKWLFKNWGESFKYLVVGDSKATEVSFIGMVWNSLWQTCVRATILSLTPMLVGYVYARYDFYGKKAVMAVHLFTMTLPLFGSGGAYMKFIHDVGLFDSPLYFILTSWNGRSPSVFIYSAAFTGLSHAYKEAAELDGASRLRIFFSIEARMTAPIFWTFFINNTFGLWNDYLNVLLYQPSFTNLSTGLYLFGTKFEKSGNMHTPIYWCGLIIGSIPPLVLFGFSSDLIFKNMALGGLKG